MSTDLWLMVLGMSNALVIVGAIEYIRYREGKSSCFGILKSNAVQTFIQTLKILKEKHYGQG